MNRLTFDPSEEGASSSQQAAETSAMEQGEKLAQANAEDQARKFERQDSENEDLSLIGGKFKSQEDLLKAYEELQRKMGGGEPEAEEEPTGEPTEPSEEQVEEQVEEEDQSDTVKHMFQMNETLANGGEVSEEQIEYLAGMDSRELVNTYLQYFQTVNAQAQAQAITNDAVTSIKASVGGDEAYTQMISWAAENLDETEIAQYNEVTSGNNAAALKFAVEALNNRFRASEGFEAKLVTGKSAAPTTKGYRSHAELSRDINDPRYANDPAFRADVEAKLEASKDLL